jgi:hypothetical protein
MSTARFSLLGETNSLFLVTGNPSLRLRKCSGNSALDSPAASRMGALPCIFRGYQGIAPETSSPPTPPTAIESAVAETFPIHLKMVPEIAVIPRGFGVAAF